MEKHKPSISITLAMIISISSLLNIHGQLPSIVDDHIQTYIVHVRRPNDTNLLRNYHKSFLPNITLDSGSPRLVYSYREVISGYAAQLTGEEVQAMASNEDFLHAYRDRSHPLLTTYTPKFLGLTDRDSIWCNSGYGKGVIIGIIDTGVDSTHPSFHDKGVRPPPSKWRGRCDAITCNNKLIGARAFRGGELTQVDTDSIGHGTHVASIAAGNFVDSANVLGNANGTSSGMAPKAHLAIYNVCSKDGCDDSDILAGIDQAIYDGVDVLSVSIGSLSRPFYEDGIATGSFSALRHQIITVAAAGNDGPNERKVANDAPWLLTVGASSTDRRIKATVRLGNGTELDGESAYQPETFNSSTILSLAFPGFESLGGEKGCRKDSFGSIDVRGKIVLCETGYNVTNIEKGGFVKMAGGVAMIVMNNKEQGDTTLSEAHVLPASHLSFSDAQKVVSYITNTSTNSTPTATIIFEGTQFGYSPSPQVASFSSRGPSVMNGGILKPDVIGPGTNILAAWPAEVGPNLKSTLGSTFNLLSGTSMATAHLAGIAALLRSSNPSWLPAAIKSAIITTADNLDHQGKPIADGYNNGTANLFAIGAGQVSPSNANDPGLIYNHQSHAYMYYLCGLGYANSQISTITQHHVQCEKIHASGAEQLNYPTISLYLGSPRKKTLRRKVENVGEENSVYFAKIDEPKGVKVEVYPLRLEFRKLYEKKYFHIEFTATETVQTLGQVSEGKLSWVSDKHVVKSPICVTFI